MVAGAEADRSAHPALPDSCQPYCCYTTCAQLNGIIFRHDIHHHVRQFQAEKADIGHFEMRRRALARDTLASGTPHELLNGGPQELPISGASVHEWSAKGVEREWWSAAGFCMSQRFEWVSMLCQPSSDEWTCCRWDDESSPKGQGSADWVDMPLCCKIESTTMSTMELFVSVKESVRTGLIVRVRSVGRLIGKPDRNRSVNGGCIPSLLEVIIQQDASDQAV
jgi:hypothetical protein